MGWRTTAAGALGATVTVTVTVTAGAAGAAPLRIYTEDEAGRATAVRAAVTAGDVAGTLLSSSDSYFRNQSLATIEASYDVLYLKDYGGNLDLSWSGLIKPYVQNGGRVVVVSATTSALSPSGQGDAYGFQLYSDADYLSPGAVERFGTPAGAVSVTAVPGLTTGVTTALQSDGPGWTAVDAGLTPFWTQGNQTLGLYGQYGAGRILFTSELDDYAARGGAGVAGNDYQLAVDELRWVTAAVPEPATAGSGVVAVAAALYRRRPPRR